MGLRCDPWEDVVSLVILEESCDIKVSGGEYCRRTLSPWRQEEAVSASMCPHGTMAATAGERGLMEAGTVQGWPASSDRQVSKRETSGWRWRGYGGQSAEAGTVQG